VADVERVTCVKLLVRKPVRVVPLRTECLCMDDAWAIVQTSSSRVLFMIWVQIYA
jgi:hypothetical protein